MESTENTSTKQPVHQSKKAAPGPRSFRDTMQHMINRQSENAIEDAHDMQADNKTMSTASQQTDSLIGGTAPLESDSITGSIAADAFLQQADNMVNDTLSQPLGGTTSDASSRQTGNTAGYTSFQQAGSTIGGAFSHQVGNANGDTDSQQADSSNAETDQQQADSSNAEADQQQADSSNAETAQQQADSSNAETDQQQADSSNAETPADESSDAVSGIKLKLPSKKIVQYIGAGAAAVLLITYLGTAFFFQNHFLFHTMINEQDFSCQTVDEARAFFAEEADNYTLEIVESGGKTEKITGKEISMTWDDNLKLDYLLDKQNVFAWPLEWFKEKTEDVAFKVSCDETALSKKADTLDAVTKEPVPPQSAYPKFDGNAFVIEPEIYGTALDSEKLKEKLLESALNLEKSIDLQEEGFYEKPKYTTESEEMIQVCKKLNDYCRASVTYEMDEPVIVDKTLISTWLSVDDNLNVTLDEEAVRNWILEFDARYDTLGSTRPLTTPTGKETEVSGGTYGWLINEDEEFAALLNSIKNGEVLTRAVSYGQTAASHAPQDWGKTFLEVDLSTQHMWYLRDGAVVFESDVVTGSTPSGMGTPAGVYTILEKLSPTILVGNIVPETGKPEYRTPVDFWMRVTYSGIGFHDATWQPAFGGDVYLWNGSHGCINMPYYNAQELYSIIEIGLPVVIHY